jgi:hypothetical protein
LLISESKLEIKHVLGLPGVEESPKVGAHGKSAAYVASSCRILAWSGVKPSRKQLQTRIKEGTAARAYLRTWVTNTGSPKASEWVRKGFKRTLHASVAACARLATERPTSQVYWTEYGAGTVWGANADGSNPRTLVTDQNGPSGVAVDASHLYWTTRGGGTIVAANLDGTGATTIATGQHDPNGVGVDATHMYWTNLASGTIIEANLDGTDATTIATGQLDPSAVAVGRRHLYWANAGANFVPGSGSIVEANLDGTGATAIATGQNVPEGVAVGPQRRQQVVEP